MHWQSKRVFTDKDTARKILPAHWNQTSLHIWTAVERWVAVQSVLIFTHVVHPRSLILNGINDHLFSPLHNMFVGKCWNGQKVVDYLLEPLQFSSLSRNKKNQDERDWVYCRVFFFFPWVHDNGDSWNGRDTVKPKWLLSLTRYRPAKWYEPFRV